MPSSGARAGQYFEKRVSALFSILTWGNYVSLLVGPKGSKERLSGLGRTDAVVPVDGMSEGTVDQLFRLGAGFTESSVYALD